VLFGDFQTARLVHFLGMAAIVAFLIVHVALALTVPRTLIAMVTGGPVLTDHPPDDAEPVPGPQEEPAGGTASTSDPPNEEMPAPGQSDQLVR
jgi:hypothetical protein